MKKSIAISLNKKIYLNDELQHQPFVQLNQAIDVGLQQLNAGNKIPASTAYKQLKQKIKAIARS